MRSLNDIPHFRTIFPLLIFFIFILSACQSPSKHMDAPYGILSIEDFEATIHPESGSAPDIFAPLLEIGYPSASEIETVEGFSFTHYNSSATFDLNYQIDGILYGVYYKLTDEKIDRSGMGVVMTSRAVLI